MITSFRFIAPLADRVRLGENWDTTAACIGSVDLEVHVVTVHIAERLAALAGPGRSADTTQPSVSARSGSGGVLPEASSRFGQDGDAVNFWCVFTGSLELRCLSGLPLWCP